jgi:hypothetical protein
MKVTLDNYRNNINTNIAVRCPHCGHFGTFETLGIHDIATTAPQNGNVIYKFLGIRKCPNVKCKGHLFFISNSEHQVLITYPSDAIPFDKDNIPEKVLNAFEEAIKSHSNNCFIAAAIMIRKTLEEISFDRGATGKNLKDRLSDLGTKIIIPKDLLMGMDDLRLLGNDAAHIEAKSFTEVGKEEIEISIDFTKEILKAVYQYESLLARLRKLKEKNNEV